MRRFVPADSPLGVRLAAAILEKPVSKRGESNCEHRSPPSRCMRQSPCGTCVLQVQFVAGVRQEFLAESAVMLRRMMEKAPSSILPFLSTSFAFGDDASGRALVLQAAPLLPPPNTLPKVFPSRSEMEASAGLPQGSLRVSPARTPRTSGGPAAQFTSAGDASFQVAVALDLCRVSDPLRFILSQFARVEVPSGREASQTQSEHADDTANDTASLTVWYEPKPPTPPNAGAIRRSVAALASFRKLRAYLFGSRIIDALCAMLALAAQEGISHCATPTTAAAAAPTTTTTTTTTHLPSPVLVEKLRSFFTTVTSWFPSLSASSSVGVGVRVQLPPLHLVREGRAMIGEALQSSGDGASGGGAPPVIDLSEDDLDRDTAASAVRMDGVGGDSYEVRVEVMNPWWWSVTSLPYARTNTVPGSSPFVNRDPWLPSLTQVAEVVRAARAFMGVERLLSGTPDIIPEYVRVIQGETAPTRTPLPGWVPYLSDGLLDGGPDGNGWATAAVATAAAGFPTAPLSSFFLPYSEEHNASLAVDVAAQTRRAFMPLPHHLSSAPFRAQGDAEARAALANAAPALHKAYPDTCEGDNGPQPLWRLLLLSAPQMVVALASKQCDAHVARYKPDGSGALDVSVKRTGAAVLTRARHAWLHTLLAGLMQVTSLPQCDATSNYRTVVDFVVCVEDTLPHPDATSTALASIVEAGGVGKLQELIASLRHNNDSNFTLGSFEEEGEGAGEGAPTGSSSGGGSSSSSGRNTAGVSAATGVPASGTPARPVPNHTSGSSGSRGSNNGSSSESGVRQPSTLNSQAADFDEIAMLHLIQAAESELARDPHTPAPAAGTATATVTAEPAVSAPLAVQPDTLEHAFAASMGVGGMKRPREPKPIVPQPLYAHGASTGSAGGLDATQSATQPAPSHSKRQRTGTGTGTGTGMDVDVDESGELEGGGGRGASATATATASASRRVGTTGSTTTTTTSFRGGGEVLGGDGLFGDVGGGGVDGDMQREEAAEGVGEGLFPDETGEDLDNGRDEIGDDLYATAATHSERGDASVTHTQRVPASSLSASGVPGTGNSSWVGAGGRIRGGDKVPRERRKWSADEVAALRRGLALNGQHWARIHSADKAFWQVNGRTEVDLKDKWRNLQRSDLPPS